MVEVGKRRRKKKGRRTRLRTEVEGKLRRREEGPGERRGWRAAKTNASEGSRKSRKQKQGVVSSKAFLSNSKSQGAVKEDEKEKEEKR